MADDNSKQTPNPKEVQGKDENTVPATPTNVAPSENPDTTNTAKPQVTQQAAEEKPANKAPTRSESTPEVKPVATTIKGLRVFPGVALGKAQKCRRCVPNLYAFAAPFLP